MKCRECNRDMQLIAVNDDPASGFAYNVYHCDPCMMLCKEDVWRNRGKIWIFRSGTTLRESDDRSKSAGLKAEDNTRQR